MSKKNKIYFISFIVIFFLLFVYAGSLIGKESFIKKFIPNNIKYFLKENIFITQNLKDKIRKKNEIIRYKNEQITKKNKIIHNLVLRNDYIKFRLNDSKLLISNDPDINFDDSIQKEIKNSSSNKYTLTTYITDELVHAKNRYAKNSSYIDNYDNNLILSSADGIFAFIDINDLLNKKNSNFKVIESNIKDIVTYEDFYSGDSFDETYFGIKDIYITGDNMYMSYIDKLPNDCYNTSILVAKINLEFLKFEKFFAPSTCVKKKNSYGKFNPFSSGGRLARYDAKNIIFTVGEFGFRDHAQNENNLFGKIITINEDTKETKLLSIGNRNPQGLYFDNSNEILYSTEHGPYGGDELNINFLKTNKDFINFGWPISSYGDHYGFEQRDDNHPKYIKATFYDSHSDYGFTEPLKYWKPSIGVSQLIEINSIFQNQNMNDSTKKFAVSSMGIDIEEGDKSIHFIDIKNGSEITNYEILPINERIRDLIYIKKHNLIFAYLESLPGIGIIEYFGN